MQVLISISRPGDLLDTEDGTPVALAANVKGQGHELKTTQELLASPAVNLLNATVTADSLHCQDQTAHLINREKGGDSLLQVRDNQPTLRVLAGQQLARKCPLFSSTDADHERSVVRQFSRVSTDPQRADFPEARQLLKSRNDTTYKKAPKDPGKAADENLTRYFISSWDEQQKNPQSMAQLIQSYWCSESRHWQRDACWREDKCRLRNANGACALALIRATLQSLVRWVGGQSLPTVFEDVAHDLSLGLGWLKQHHLHR